MPSKKSKTPPNPRQTTWKAASDFSEAQLESLVREFSAELKPGDRILLEGPLGAGKSTFARALLKALGARQPAEGSPTFAIAHEYEGPQCGIVHMDFYRLRSEAEIEDAGISSYFWERNLIVIAEWISLHPEFRDAVWNQSAGHRNWSVSIGFVENRPELRKVVIESRAG